MKTVRKLAVCAVVPFTLLLQACGKTEPGFSKSIDVSQHLTRLGSDWQQQPERQARVVVGTDSIPVTVRWIPAVSDGHRGISRITVDFPEHRAGDRLDAMVLGGPINMGTTAAILEALTLNVEWQRNGASRAQLATAQVVLKGDGSSTLLE